MKGIILFSDELRQAWLTNEKNEQALSNIGGMEVFCKQIIKEITFVNSKYNITEVRFVNFNDIPELYNLKFRPAGYIVEVQGERFIPNAYICISNPDVGSRNAMGAQHLFPALSKLVEEYLDSPGYELTNLPMYFLYGSKDPITDSIKQSIIAMELMGVKCIPIFYEGEFLNESTRAKIIADFRRYANYSLWEYADLLAKEPSGNIEEIRTDYFIVNKTNRTIKFIKDSFIEGTLGSRDRFFVIKAYPALILADNMKYDIAFDEIENYVKTYGYGRNNFMPFINYAKKLVGRRSI